ncbi:hypothetical protein [Variovorax sp. RHLX14]
MLLSAPSALRGFVASSAQGGDWCDAIEAGAHGVGVELVPFAVQTTSR